MFIIIVSRPWFVQRKKGKKWRVADGQAIVTGHFPLRPGATRQIAKPKRKDKDSCRNYKQPEAAISGPLHISRSRTSLRAALSGSIFVDFSTAADPGSGFAVELRRSLLGPSGPSPFSPSPEVVGMALRGQFWLVCLGVLCSMGAQFRTTNFIIDVPTPQVAQQIGQYAEHYRQEKGQLWLGREMPNWNQPLPIRVTVTLNGAGGATEFRFDNGQVLEQNMHIEGSLDRLLSSVLPHEITHTVFAYHFRCPLPRGPTRAAPCCRRTTPRPQSARPAVPATAELRPGLPAARAAADAGISARGRARHGPVCRGLFGGELPCRAEQSGRLSEFHLQRHDSGLGPRFARNTIITGTSRSWRKRG